jgi:acyl-CoA hydrolase
MSKTKVVSESLTIMTEMIFPNDTNTLGNLMGGNLMRMMDVVGAIAAQKHCNRIVVTASVDNVSFKQSVPLGSVVTLQAKVTRAFNSSMEVVIDVWAENSPAQQRVSTNKAFFTFVAVDQSGRPIDVPQAIPETDEEKEYFEGALRRRQLRLVLAGRLPAHEASELKALFDIQ